MDIREAVELYNSTLTTNGHPRCNLVVTLPPAKVSALADACRVIEAGKVCTEHPLTWPLVATPSQVDVLFPGGEPCDYFEDVMEALIAHTCGQRTCTVEHDVFLRIVGDAQLTARAASRRQEDLVQELLGNSEGEGGHFLPLLSCLQDLGLLPKGLVVNFIRVAAERPLELTQSLAVMLQALGPFIPIIRSGGMLDEAKFVSITPKGDEAGDDEDYREVIIPTPGMARWPDYEDGDPAQGADEEDGPDGILIQLFRSPGSDDNN